MKKKSCRSIYLIFLLFVLLHEEIQAQVEQPGVVMEYNERLAKTPLGDVQILVKDAGQRVSDKDGTFVLRFRTKQIGEHVDVTEISKLNYEIFNQEALEQWNITGEKRPFVIVMCKSSRFKKIKDNLNRVSSESYAKQFKKDQEKLQAERNSGKLKEADYQKRLQLLQDEFDKQTESIRPYIDRFARIDLTELSAKEQDIVQMIQEGKTEQAIEEYKKLDLERKVKINREEYRKLEEATNIIDNAKKQKQEERDSLFAQVHRKNDALILLGGVENLKNVEDSYHQIAESDTTYLYGLSAYSSFLFVRNRHQENLRYLHLIVKCGERDFHQYLSSMYHSLGYAYLRLNHYEKAKLYFEKSKDANELYNRNDSLTYLGNLAVHCDDMASIAENENDSIRQGELLIQEVDIMRNLFCSNPSKYQYGYEMALQMLLQYCAKHNSKKTDDIIAEIKRMLVTVSDANDDERKWLTAFTLTNLANVSINRGESQEAIMLLKQAERIVEPLYQKDSEKYSMYAAILAIIGGQYVEQDLYTEAKDYLEKALPLCESVLNKNNEPNAFTTLTSVQFLLANILSIEGKQKEAESLFSKAWINIQNLDSVGIKSENRFGLMGKYMEYIFEHYYRYGDKIKAEEYLHRLVKLDEDIKKELGEDYCFPDICSTYYNLAIMSYEQERYKEAEKNALLCLINKDENTMEKEIKTVRFILIESLFIQGKYDEGLKYLDFFLEDVKGEERLYHLHAKGMFLLKKGDIKKARTIWNDIKDKVDAKVKQTSILNETFK